MAGILDAGPLRGSLTNAINVATTLTLGTSVAVLDSNTLAPIFYGVEIMRVRVRKSKRVLSHPLETGAMIADHQVIEPKEIELDILVPSIFYISVYQQINAAYTAGELLIVQTNADIYQNMIVSEMPHEESPEYSGVLVMSLRLREVLFVAPVAVLQQSADNPPSVPSNYAPLDPTDSNTIQRGQCTAIDPLGNGSNISPSFGNVNVFSLLSNNLTTSSFPIGAF